MSKIYLIIISILVVLNMQAVRSVDFIQTSLEQQLLLEINEYRTSLNLPQLKIDLKLSQIARNRSIDLSQTNNFSHTSDYYGSTRELLRKYPYPWQKASENLSKGVGDAGEILLSFSNSNAHQKNLVDVDFDLVGIGCFFNENGELYCTLLFIDSLFSFV